LWRRVTWLSDAAVAERIRADRIDILVDLSGHSDGNRLPVFARKPAPVQVTAWGHATGTGIAAVDYLLADAIAVPAHVRSLFAERVVDLPCIVGYDSPAGAPPVAPAPSCSGRPITFGCFNRLAKISDQTVALWAQLLSAVPHSRLALKDAQLSNPAERSRMAGIFARRGIDAGRLLLLPGTSHIEHLAAYAEVDIGLDPIPVSGGVTTMEALWMGVPVVSLLGKSLAGRISAAIVSAAGLETWAASTEDEYVAVARRAAIDVPALSELRRTMRSRMRASKIADPQAYCGAVEEAYRTMWRSYCGS
jgi:predicted O-linked N-acetylglucosamine transferase (SPINDLY family)